MWPQAQVFALPYHAPGIAQAKNSDPTLWATPPPKTALMYPAADHLTQAPKARPARIVLATVIGNAFVAYDFTVYSFSAVIIGKL
ncbi:MAG TPA: hypothetical protein VKJ77_24935, partial [Caballeronia sp.]|nr:hypothetical protein [Caballeronia sp.]